MYYYPLEEKKQVGMGSRARKLCVTTHWKRKNKLVWVVGLGNYVLLHTEEEKAYRNG